MITTKTCTKCHETKPVNEFHKDNRNKKDGKRANCKECSKNYNKKYNQKHHEEKNKKSKKYYEDHKDELRKQQGSLSMYENKSCPAYLGVVIAERLVRHLFNNVQVMPYGNPKFDFICNKGKKIDVKSGCITLTHDKNPRWKFIIRRNKIADFFILVAFDNLTDLNPLHLWMIPGHEINKNGSKSIRPSTVHKWSQWERDIKDAQLCCDTMKK